MISVLKLEWRQLSFFELVCISSNKTLMKKKGVHRTLFRRIAPDEITIESHEIKESYKFPLLMNGQLYKSGGLRALFHSFDLRLLHLPQESISQVVFA